MSFFTEYYYNCRRRVLSRLVKKKVNISDVSIISMNCIGGIFYHDCNVQFLSPTINMFFLPSDFIKFVDNLNYYLSITPEVIMGEKFPIGTLADIKVFFMHYSSPEEALSKWETRKKRINPKKIFVIMVERDGFSDEDFENFKSIRYPKILYTINKKYQIDDSLYFSRFKDEPQLPDIIPGRYMYSKMKLIKQINCAFSNGR